MNTPTLRWKSHLAKGSTLLAALGAMTVLAMIAGVMITRINMNYRASFHSASWEEAFRASEDGADLAIASLNLLSINSTTAWSGWSAPDASNKRVKVFSTSSTPALPAHSGEGNTKIYASVEATPFVSGGRTWYRIRSTGTAELPGSKAVTEEASLRNTSEKKNHFSNLRKLTFVTDKTSGSLRVPQVSRKIEVMSYPTSAKLFQRALTTALDLTMSGGAYTDSFDSSDPLKSNNGLYYWPKHQSNGDVATNITGNSSDLNSNPVYGDAMSNGGTIQDTSGVKGTVINNFQTELPSVPLPTALPNNPWTTFNVPFPRTLSGLQTLTAGTKASPTRFQYTSIDLGSKDSLVLVNPNPIDPITGTQAPAYIEIWSTGDMKTNAQAIFTIQPGVTAKFFVQGNFSISGGGVNNLSSRAANLFLYGVTPLDGSPREFKLTGSADFTGVVYAPSFDFTCVGGGDFQGAIIAKTAKVSGNAGYHYDEALGIVDSDTAGGYQMGSWVEDIQ